VQTHIVLRSKHSESTTCSFIFRELFVCGDYIKDEPGGGEGGREHQDRENEKHRTAQ
jgi:hypothetical protein